MFPKNIQFVSTPSRLQQAIESLPEPKGKVRRSVSKDNALRSKLLQIETAQLRQWKLKPAMLKLIPALARERDNTVLQEKVLAIVVTSLENMDLRTLMDVVSLYWDNDEFRLAFNAHCVRKPPSEHRWLAQYYKAFRAEDPPGAIVDTLDKEQPLYNLHKHLDFQTSNPLFIAICQSYAERLNVSHVSSWSWGQLVSFLKSGYPLDVRQQVFEWVLIEYIGVSTDLGTILQSEYLMTLFSLNLLPKRHRQHLPQHLQGLLESVCKHQRLGRWLSGAELESWKDVIPFVHSVLVHRPSGWLCVLFGSHVLIWPMSKRESTVAIVSIVNFRQRLQSKLRQPIPVALHQSIVVHSLTKNMTWSSEFLQWLDDVKTESQRQRENWE
jgi:hypothetical protein